jgi:CheY-like chemotaxis protein
MTRLAVSEAPSAFHLHQCRILLVEDHDDSARAFEILLRERGFVVQLAADVQSALRLALKGKFDVVLCDIRLPDGSGLDLMRRLHEEPRLSNLKGICVTALGMPNDIETSREAGFSAHVTKPVDIHLLLGVIERVCG